MDKESWEWDEIDYFRLVDDLSINEAAALIAGASPNDLILEDYDGATWHLRDDRANRIFSAVVIALTRAVERGVIPAIFVTGSRPKFWKTDSSAEWQPIGNIDQSRPPLSSPASGRPKPESSPDDSGFFMAAAPHVSTGYPITVLQTGPLL